jgi:hypothetical protein
MLNPAILAAKAAWSLQGRNVLKPGKLPDGVFFDGVKD